MKPAWNRSRVDESAVCQRYRETHSSHTVSEEFGVCVPTVLRILRENGQPLLPRIVSDEQRKISHDTIMRTHRSGNMSGRHHWNWQGGKKTVKCCICGADVPRDKGRVARSPVCGIECNRLRARTVRGSRCGAWRGGVTSLVLQIRGHFKYKEWRKGVLAKYGRSCCECGSTEQVDVHHGPVSLNAIVKKYDIKTIDDAVACEQLWNVDNGKPMCRHHHLRVKDHYRPDRRGIPNLHNRKMDVDRVCLLRTIYKYGGVGTYTLARATGLNEESIRQAITGETYTDALRVSPCRLTGGL